MCAYRPMFFHGTFAPEFLPDDDDGAVRLNQLWLKRVRRRFPVRFFSAIEHGSASGRVHTHSLMWIPAVVTIGDRNVRRHLQEQWIYGRSEVAPCRTRASFSYCAKYAVKGGRYTFSRNPGVGAPGIQRWRERIERVHSLRKFKHRDDLPAFHRCQVLGTTQVIRIPESAVKRACLELGVQYAPDDLTEYQRYAVQFLGAPTGPLKSDDDLKWILRSRR